MDINQHFRADNHALACAMVPLNGFISASFMHIAIQVAGTSYSGPRVGPGASYCYSAGVVGILCCIMAASCIHTLLGANFSIKTDKLNKNSTTLIKIN